MEKGLAYAVKCGCEKAKYPIIAVLDADGSHPPETLPNMIRKLYEGYDVVVGSRYVEGGANLDTRFRRWISLIYCYLAQKILNLKVKDSMSGYIVARKFCFKESLNYCLGLKFGLELLANPKYRIYEYPITFKKRKTGQSKSILKIGLQTLRLIMKLWWKNLAGF